MCYDPLRFIQWFNDLVGWIIGETGSPVSPIFLHSWPPRRVCAVGTAICAQRVCAQMAVPILVLVGIPILDQFWFVNLFSRVFGCLSRFEPRQTVTFLGPLTFASGHTALNTPDPIRTRKLSSARPGQYWGGGPPGKSLGCCWLFAAACLLPAGAAKSPSRRSYP